MLSASVTHDGSATTSGGLHVVHGVLSLDVGGLERLVVDLVREGRRRGQRVSVVCLERAGQLASEVATVGAELHSLGKPRGRHPETARRAAALLARLQPDVVHTHQIGALWHLGRAARQLGGLPVLHTEHSDHVAHARGWLEKLKVRLMWRRAAPLAGRFCCVSDDVARSVQRFGTVPRRKVDVVLNGIDLAACSPSLSTAEVRAALGIPVGALVIGTVGRLVEVKQQDLLLQAFARLRQRGQQANTWLLIVGDGPERPRLERLAAGLGVIDHTIFAGYQAHPQRLLAALDVFALTSRHEGLPLALLEAWGAGLPVISSAVGAIPQTIVDGVSGLLFRSGDQQGLAKTLERLLDSPALMNELGRRGRARAERRYSLTRMADEYAGLYQALLQEQEAAVR